MALTTTFPTITHAEELNSPQAIQQPVIALHETLLELMQNANKTSYQERYAMLESVIKQEFDTDLIAKIVLSRYWQSLDEKQQADFINLFNRLTVVTYLDRFDTFENERFSTIGNEEMKKNRYMVKTELLIPNDKPVFFNYIVQNNSGDISGWKIISIIANGVNDLALKRVEYSTVIQNESYAALINDIKGKIADLEKKDST